MEIGSLLLEDGLTRSVRPKDGDKFSMEELQFFVGGNLEIIPMKNPASHLTLYVNEDGKRLQMTRNALGTLLAECPPGDPVVGPVLLVHEVQPNSIPRARIEVKAAHDILHPFLTDKALRVECDREEIASLFGAASALCWILGHDSVPSFEGKLSELRQRLRRAGYVIV